MDRNATGHVAVLANLSSGKVLKLGKSCLHIKDKYRNLRAESQRRDNKFTKTLKRDMSHKILKKIIEYCLEHKAILVLEDLSGIRRDKKSKGKKWRSKKANKIVHSWGFYQLELFLNDRLLANKDVNESHTGEAQIEELLVNRRKQSFSEPPML